MFENNMIRLVRVFAPYEVAEMLDVTEKSIGNRAVTVRRKLRIPRDQFTTYALEHNQIERDQARVIRRTDRS